MAISFQKKPGLVAYITAGDPDLATTRDIVLAAIDNGADVIELGVPFSDPLADGPVIQRASQRAVARGTRLTDVLSIAAEVRAARPNAGLVLFSYLNPVVRLGMDAFCEQAAHAGIDGVLLTDMIVEESDDYLAAMRGHNLAPIYLAAPTSPDERLKKIAAVSQGFVYAISRLGVTGMQSNISNDAGDIVSRLRRFTTLPIALGFGISSAEHIHALAASPNPPDAAVVGSAIVQLIEKTQPKDAAAAVGKFIAELRA